MHRPVCSLRSQLTAAHALTGGAEPAQRRSAADRVLQGTQWGAAFSVTRKQREELWACCLLLKHKYCVLQRKLPTSQAEELLRFLSVHAVQNDGHAVRHADGQEQSGFTRPRGRCATRATSARAISQQAAAANGHTCCKRAI
jgi:hypothetical protein